ncbi:MAG TPA: SDR family oxidoreductase [Gammaproteobacteria bacterium]|nr:SDR family oxidoreductase [Gammaproteobacteria bacterium]
MGAGAGEMRFDDQVVLITGASRGIGREAAKLFASAGARVAVHYRSRRVAAEETLALLKGGGHAVFSADLADEQAVSMLVDEVVERMGGLEVLVNNAGIFEYHEISEVAFDQWLDAWRRTLATNLVGPACLSYLAARRMMKTGGGRIVNVSSRGAFRGEPRAPAYGASKAGLNAMGQSLAQALAPHGVYVFTVAPGFVDTEMAKSSLSGPGGDAIRSQSPLGRVARPEEVARTVLFLASKGSEYLTGGIVDVNGASYLRS